MFSYLKLYYCSLSHAQPVAFAIIALWLTLLFTTIGIAASDFFCINLATIANILGMSDNLAGVTFLAFGNGSPDIFSTFAAFSTNSGSLAIGELIGAASFITSVVAGSIAFVRPFKVPKKTFVRDVSFFIIAASFSLVFLYDGKLHLWECSVLVGLYVFYVIFVLVWHWYFHRRMIQRRKEAAAREHFIVPGSEEAELTEEYHDDVDDAGVGHGHASPRRQNSVVDLANLERAERNNENDEDDDDEQRDGAALAEINRKMRISRPRARSRALTGASIRPSLVGALEFRAVMADLQRSRNINTMPIHLRRYSDDPRNLQDDQRSFQSEPSTDAALLTVNGDSTAQHHDLMTRGRAVSASGLENMAGGVDRSMFPAPRIDLLGPLAEDDSSLTLTGPSATSEHDWPAVVSPSPTVSISPSQSLENSAFEAFPSVSRLQSSNHLAPPDPFASTTLGTATSSTVLEMPSQASIKRQTPQSNQSQTKRPQTERLTIPGAADETAPPAYGDADLVQPQSRASPALRLLGEYNSEITNDRPLRWWPYAVLPPPRELFSTLFPTVDNWHEKSFFQRIVGVAMLPSVLLLKVTLPVVETEREEEVDEDIPEINVYDTSPTANANNSASSLLPTGIPSDIIIHGDDGEEQDAAAVYSSALGEGEPSAVIHQSEAHDSNRERQRRTTALTESSDSDPSRPKLDNEKDWTRWLVIVQLFTAPLFVVLIFWANTSMDQPGALVRPILISLLASLVVLVALLLTTSADKAPRWRILLCFAGFAVSISWISTIANEVVGVLKTIGVILDISDAILGLTIFAVGNSCGDLVANVTVGRLGFPNMALSACFGGPMLNILLGIGLSGMYLTIRGAQDRAEHGKKYMFKPYQIDVSRTLLISGATLLVTLVVLLTVVPLRRWKMDRVLGWALVAFWTSSTVLNVVVEAIGWGAKSSS